MWSQEITKGSMFDEYWIQEKEHIVLTLVELYTIIT